MTPDAAEQHLWEQIRVHARLFFSSAAAEMLDERPIRFLPYGVAVDESAPGILIPSDVSVECRPEGKFEVPFNGTVLTLWNPLPRPARGEWTALPNDSAPLWYRSRHGTLLPAWNLFGNLLSLVTFAEERGAARDRHGRFRSSDSPRDGAGLLEVPAFNEAVAALVAAQAGLCRDGSSGTSLDGMLKPPVVVLSHDCDLLRGNDAWTQAVRAWRIVRPLARGRPPALRNLWWICNNLIRPRRYYLDNVTGMIALESQFGFTSTFYLLNGRGGRYGARSGWRVVEDLVRLIPHGWDIGVHYNYDTFLDGERFAEQLGELTTIAPRRRSAGRAHYLRFDGERSPPFLESFGLHCDESAGYPDRIGYRCGIGGCFRAFDVMGGRPLRLWEVPLAVMEQALIGQYGRDPVAAFSRLLAHLGRVGGALSLLVHPGMFHNPEVPEMLGLYHRLLIEARGLTARSITAPRLAELAAAAAEALPRARARRLGWP